MIRRNPKPRSRRIFRFHRPSTLAEWLSFETLDEWTAEWRIPLAVLGKNRDAVSRLQLNLGIYHQGSGLWVVWVGTGAEVFRVESAGEVVLER